jgi:transposase
VARHVARLACERPDVVGRELCQWDCAELARQPERAAIVAAISPRTVGRILTSRRLTPWRVHSWLSPKGPRDAEFLRRTRAVADLLTRPLGAHEVVLSLDAMTSLQPRPRAVPNRPAAPGRPVRLEHEYRRAGAMHLFAAFDTRGGRAYGECV